ncbi:MAG: hypothetical protein Q7U71_03435, partial [bacterium]|nr:hypothetical protein [bacterium]
VVVAGGHVASPVICNWIVVDRICLRVNDTIYWEKINDYFPSLGRYINFTVLFFLCRQQEKNQKKKLVAKNHPGAALLACGGLV